MVPMMQMTVSQRHRASCLEVAVDHHLPWDNVVVAAVLHTQEVADPPPILGVAVDHRVPPMMVAVLVVQLQQLLQAVQTQVLVILKNQVLH